MGRLEVWKYLRLKKDSAAHLSKLNHPAEQGCVAIRSAWSDLQKHSQEERLKKGTNLKQVLNERPDLFRFASGGGAPLIILTQAAQDLSPEDGLPEYDETAVETEGDVPDVPVQPPAPKRQKLEQQTVAHSQAKWAQWEPVWEPQIQIPRGRDWVLSSKWEPVFDKGRFYDIVWTPELAEQRAKDRRTEREMTKSLLEAIQNHPGCAVKVSTLGGDYKEAQLKKAPQFKNDKLKDILDRHADLFEVTGDTVTVKPGAEEAMLARDLAAPDLLPIETGEADLTLLPDRIEDPANAFE